MLNYEIEPALLASFVPSGTELDLYNGKAFISLVGFQFLNTRVCGVSIPFHRNFEEVNLRFYLRRSLAGEVRRGVAFIREIVPRWAIASVARTLYNERYVALPMSHGIETNDGSVSGAEYRWRSTVGWNRMILRTEGSASLPEQGSEEQFITEHYWGYAAQGNGGTVEYRVDHPSWRVWNVSSARFEGDMTELYGPEFAILLCGSPSSAFLAEGSEVTVSRGIRI
jgi:uncharacterized protein YqjF (DUF2071 family)